MAVFGNTAVAPQISTVFQRTVLRKISANFFFHVQLHPNPTADSNSPHRKTPESTLSHTIWSIEIPYVHHCIALILMQLMRWIGWFEVLLMTSFLWWFFGKRAVLKIVLVLPFVRICDMPLQESGTQGHGLWGKKTVEKFVSNIEPREHLFECSRWVWHTPREE